MAGVTPEGFTRKTFTQIQSEMQAYLRAKISKNLQLTEKTGLGNVLNSACDQLAEAWEAVEASYNAFDKDNALDAAFVALCELTGTKRKGPTKGVVLATCNFTAGSGGLQIQPGDLIAHVFGEPNNRWVNRDRLTVAGGLTADYDMIFVAETAGAIGVATAGTLTEIAQSFAGWNSVTNSTSATAGFDIEPLEDLYVRREQEMEGQGTQTLGAIRSAVSKVSGVVEVRCFENKTDYVDVYGLAPHSIQVIVFDGISPAASNEEIAQAILDHAPPGIPTVGTTLGAATNLDGEFEPVYFTRATQIPVYVSADVSGVTTGVAAAIVKEGSKLNMGDAVVREKLKGAAISVDGVDDIVTFTLGTAPSPVGTSNLILTRSQIALFDVSRVVVT